MSRPFVLLVFTSLLSSGCSVVSITANSVGSKVSQSLALENRAAPHKSVMVHGFLERTPSDLEHNVLVVAVSTQGELAATVSVGKSGLYTLFLPQGEFLLSAYVDRNDDLIIEPVEIAGQIVRPVSIVSSAKRAHLGVDIRFDFPNNTARKYVDVIEENISLDEGIPSIEPAEELIAERFGDDNIRLGSDESTTAFFNHVAPLQYLDEIDITDERTPIVFVHGISDSPRIFERLESEVPRSEFQSFYYYYPTGARLPYAAQLLHYLFLSGKVLPTNPRLVLVAHSMGGLVTRGSLNEVKGSVGESKVELYASFATPYGGVVAANFATTSSPAIVPSWIDVASKSDYIRDLFPPLPSETTFKLCAANKFGNGDGTIPLESQKAPPAVKQASTVREFPDTHVGIVYDSAAIGQFTEWAKEFAGPVFTDSDSPGEKTAQPRIALGNLEKRRRGEVLLGAIIQEASKSRLEVRVSLIAPTLFRFRFSQGDTSVVIQATAGQGLRFDVPTEDAPLTLTPWPTEENQLEETVAELVASAIHMLARTPEVDPEVSKPDASDRLSVMEASRKTPPFHLGSGLSINLDPGAQHYSLVTPFFMDMYFGRWGLGLDARVTVFAPIHQTPTANVKYDPFYLLSGPRFRWGAADDLLTGTLALNGGVALGRVTVSEPGPAKRFPDRDDVIRYTNGTRFLASGAFTLGVRIKKDFYAITRLEAGIRPSEVDVDVDAADPLQLNGRVFGNIRLGVEVRVP